MWELEKRYTIIDKQKNKEMATITSREWFDYILMAWWLVMLSKMQTWWTNANYWTSKSFNQAKRTKRAN